jgi:hypothetical protein
MTLRRHRAGAGRPVALLAVVLSIPATAAAAVGPSQGAPVWSAVMLPGQTVEYYLYSGTEWVEQNGTTTPRPPSDYAMVGSQQLRRRSVCEVQDQRNRPLGQHGISWYVRDGCTKHTPAPGCSSTYPCDCPDSLDTKAQGDPTWKFPYPPPGQFSVSRHEYGRPGTGIKGLQFKGLLDGHASVEPSSQPPSTYVIDAVYFATRACSDGGYEYGFYRTPAVASNIASDALYQQGQDEEFFYYSAHTNCPSYDYWCKPYGNNGTVFVPQHTRTVRITDISPNVSGEHRFWHSAYFPSDASRVFRIQLTDPYTYELATCRFDGGPPGPCTLDVPIEYFFFDPSAVMNDGHVVIAVQTNEIARGAAIGATPIVEGARVVCDEVKLGK